MDMQKEFIDHANEAIEHQSHVDGKNHSGEGMEIILPVPGEFCIDGIDPGEINLNDAKISVFEGDERRDKSGNVIFDRGMFPPGIVLYRVTGIIR